MFNMKKPLSMPSSKPDLDPHIFANPDPESQNDPTDKDPKH